MTLVMLWRSDKGIAVAADTRISDGTSPITDAGPKLFQIPIVAMPFGLDTKPQRFEDVGFAFAGNTLSAQSTVSMASTCLQNLVGPEPVVAPSLAEISDYICRCADYIVRSREFARPLDSSRFEAAVFGYCKREERFAAFVLDFESDQDGVATARSTEFDLTTQLLLLGSGSQKVRDLIDLQLSRKAIPVHPTSLLAAIIDDPAEPSVGGNFQYARGDESGVRLVPAAVLVEAHRVELSVLGCPMGELGDIAGMYPSNAHIRGPDLP